MCVPVFDTAEHVLELRKRLLPVPGVMEVFKGVHDEGLILVPFMYATIESFNRTALRCPVDLTIQGH
eukprot:scaffold145564_cov31-Prasinocladus_malaysianus.AAC.1